VLSLWPCCRLSVCPLRVSSSFIRSVFRALNGGVADHAAKVHMTKIKAALSPVLLCATAAAGDVEQLRFLVDSGVNLEVGDYDRRTALHLAASEGKLECVEYLLSVGAFHSPEDRWEGTPLDVRALLD
jgi:hypothetical protein